MKHVRLLEMAGSREFEVGDRATLSDVLAMAGTTLQEGKVLSQNGRPANVSDPVEDQALVMQMPRAHHG